LAGELRGVGQLEHRLREASKLGFRTALVPGGVSKRTLEGMELAPVSTLREAIGILNL
jgi:DNA repair protein RadA/Sms